MSEKSDHLIERAAALLQSANAAQAGDGAPPAAASSSAQRAAGEPKRVPPPPRMMPPAPLPGPLGARRSPTPLSRSGSIADIRAGLKQPAIPLTVLERSGLMVARAKRTRTAEEYRIVMGRVLRALHEEPELNAPASPEALENVVMITSARPGEGKSFTALNLGASVAQNAGESVLLIDVDTKNDSLSDHLGLNEAPGFLDLLAKPELPLEELVFPTELANLFVMPLGRRSKVEDHAIVDLGSQGRRFASPVTLVARRFPKSLILLDAPPCLSTSDPHALAPSVGQVVMVVEAEKTQRTEIEAAIEMVKESPNITLLLNKIKTTTSHTFGSYDYFGTYT